MTEQQGPLEVMRHLPALVFLKEKIGKDYRRQAFILLKAAQDAAGGGGPNPEIETAFRCMARCLERVGEIARGGRQNGQTPHNQPFSVRLDQAFEQAVRAMDAVSEQEYGRRSPFHTFERSRWETLYATVLRVHEQILRLIVLIERVDPALHERLFEESYLSVTVPPIIERNVARSPVASPEDAPVTP